MVGGGYGGRGGGYGGVASGGEFTLGEVMGEFDSMIFLSPLLLFSLGLAPIPRSSM